MWKIILVFVIGLLLAVAVGGAYYIYVGIGMPFSDSGEDWAQFGNYFGGVAGPLLSFISILLLVYAILMQNRQLSDAQHEMLKRDLLSHADKVEEQIDRWLERRLAIASLASESVEFGDIVWGIREGNYVDPEALKSAVVRLHELTRLYCEALVLHRKNIDTFFIFKYHRQKAQALLNFLSANQSLLDQTAVPSLMSCQIQLDGRPQA